MSGDVQPRKRKDKKRKRDAFDRKSEGEVTFSRQQSVQDEDESSSHGVHITKMAGDDVHLHVHEDHDTGGHWCAKVFFFGLLVVLLGLVGLIILENRGLADLDTPLSESRFSNYFDGWVEEHREEHEEHAAVAASIEDHDDHDEPFEEEEDHSEVSEDDDHVDHDDEEDDHDDNDDDDEEKEDEQNATEEEDEQTKENDDDDNDEEDDDDDNDREDEEENLTKTMETEDDDDDNNTAEENDDDNDGDDNENNSIENTIEASQEDNEDNDEDNEDDDNDNDDNDNDDNDNDENDDDNDSADDEEPIKPVYTRSTHQSAKSQQSNADDDDPFDEEDDDGTFESLENVVVDNDAEELLLLQEKARQQAAEASKNDPPSAEDDEEDETAEKTSSWASLAAKIIVGVALPLVARLVLIRKNPNTNEEPSPEILMKRRLTIASAEDTFPEDETEAPTLEDEYSEEEIEIEEEIEYVEEEEEVEVDENGDVIKTMGSTYAPESFEQLNAMYKSKDYDIETPPPKQQTQHTQATQERKVELNELEQNFNKTQPIIQSTTQASKKAPAIFNAPPPPPLVEAKVQPLPTTSTHEEMLKNLPSARPPINPSAAEPAEHSPNTTQRELDYPPEDDDIEYDDEDEYSDEEEEEEDEEDLLDEDDVSDVDDAELMSRLEAKYGRLPANEFESDEDPDDPTWTQIKPKQPSGGGVGGPQSNDDNDDDEDDLFEQELRRANEEMMRENFPAALKVFSLLTQKYPDKPQTFLGKAKSLDHLAERQRSNQLLSEALEAYKRYLAFGDVIANATEYRAAAERCIERMRFMGNDMQAVPIHEQLIERFSDEPNPRNQLAVTFLLINRLSDAKATLRETLSRWPSDGFAQVHYGFVLKQHDNDYENAIKYLKYGIDSKAEGTQDGRFFSNLGEALQRLGRQSEALEVYRHGADLRLFPSVYQRSMYNEPRLRAQPFWTKQETTYAKFLNKLEQNWLAIRDEGLSVLSKSGYFMDEAENLRDSGDWQQFELYARGQRKKENCQKAPITCSLIAEFGAASGCRRGQVKFSVMHPGTHVWPHVGPTNCRLRAHLGLIVPAGTRLRVADEESTWSEGKFILFDDSFEHEVWHNGSSLRLVLIVDIWHPDLSEQRRRSLTPI